MTPLDATDPIAGASNLRRTLRRAIGILAWTAAMAMAIPAGAEEPLDPELRRLLQQAIDSPHSFYDRYEAEVWLTDMSGRLARFRPGLAHDERLDLLVQIHREASRAAISPELVLAVIDVESRFDRFAISSVGAQGLMQVMPFWLKEIGHSDDNLFVVETNLRLGCTILKYYIGRTNGDVRRALNRYNGTRQRKYSDKVLEVLSTRWYKS